VAIKYRAFLSYSHTDTGWAKWLHARLESFHIDKELVGSNTRLGPVPTTLRPIFRDREDFSGGHTLTDATIIALDASAALIVLCSPISASRPAVNEEVRLFRARHPDRPVVPVIIDGSAPGNLPPALRYELAADGTITNRPITILGSDLREAADGKNLGLAKTIAGLIGLGPDDIYRRAERERRRLGRQRAAVASAMVIIMMIGGALFWQSRQQQQTLSEVAALVDKYEITSDAQPADPGARERLTRAITAIAEGAAIDPRYAKALELLKADKPAEAEPLLKAFAEEKAKLATKNAKNAGAAYRNLATVTAVSDPKRAREYYAEAARLDPSDVWGMFQNGWFQQDAGQLDAAQTAYLRVIATGKPGSDERAIYWAQLGLGDIQKDRGNLGGALDTYYGAKATADRLAKADPGNAGWQRDLSGSYDRIGEILAARGNLSEALKSYHDGLEIADRLAKADPGNARLQRDLSACTTQVIDVEPESAFWL
jgi:tetratricopeptide (TPR) repeat protein